MTSLKKTFLAGYNRTSIPAVRPAKIYLAWPLPAPVQKTSHSPCLLYRCLLHRIPLILIYYGGAGVDEPVQEVSLIYTGTLVYTSTLFYLRGGGVDEPVQMSQCRRGLPRLPRHSCLHGVDDEALVQRYDYTLPHFLSDSERNCQKMLTTNCVLTVIRRDDRTVEIITNEQGGFTSVLRTSRVRFFNSITLNPFHQTKTGRPN